MLFVPRYKTKVLVFYLAHTGSYIENNQCKITQNNQIFLAEFTCTKCAKGKSMLMGIMAKTVTVLYVKTIWNESSLIAFTTEIL